MWSQIKISGGIVWLCAVVILLSGCPPVQTTPGSRPESPTEEEIARRQAEEQRRRLTPEWAYQQGLQYFNNQMYEQAVQYFQLATERNPEHLRAYLGLGDAHRALEQYLVAETYYNKVLERDPQSVPALSALGTMHHNLGNYREALSLYRKVLDLDPNNQFARQQIETVTQELFDIHYAEGRRYKEAGNLKMAAAKWQKAHSLYPDDLDFAVEIGKLFLEQHDYLMADGYFQRVLSADPEHIPALIGAGRVQLALTHYTEAINYFERGLRLRPDDPELRALLQQARDEKIRATLPPQYAAIGSVEQVTRGEVAALLVVELQLESRLSASERPEIISDITTHWAKPYIIQVVQLGIMQVFPDRSFLPNEPIRKGELAFVLDSLFQQLNVPLPAGASASFSDVHPENMYYPAVCRIYAAGLMTGHPDGSFGFNDPVSGAEALRIFDRVNIMLGQP
jgi:tetratricopeptide (TPR) repeat protein